MRTVRASNDPAPDRPRRLRRRRPRSYEEWSALRRWKRLPEWEVDPIGFQLRSWREQAGLTQSELGERMGISQQAVAQAERWQSNPTVRFLRQWVEALPGGYGLRIELDGQGADSWA